MKYSHVLWDFNGTLLDDVGIGMDSINALLRPRKIPTLDSREAYRKVFRFPIEEYYRALGFDFEKEPYDLLAHEWVAEYRKREKTAPLFEGVRELLTYLKELKIPQILFSATQQQMLCEQVEDLGIGEFFDEILGSDDIYAEGKTQRGLDWLKRVNPPRPVLIGDTLHDGETARAMGIDCILVAQGHASAETLAKTGFPVTENLRTLKNVLIKS
ncbi:MAG: HAD hydrolase-like protein [Clostridia bacterium]|nr:HAD hydrolase-like protein [Clostridia bacterium]